jgi:NAD(P)-dependent dehydrogenase (short-subunit alcohol dehydrogenase family)
MGDDKHPFEYKKPTDEQTAKITEVREKVCRRLCPGSPRRYGRVVTVSPGARQLATMSAYAPVYSISKAAVDAFTRILADTCRADGMLVNAVDPDGSGRTYRNSFHSEDTNARRRRSDRDNPLSFNHDVLVWTVLLRGLITVTSAITNVCDVCAAVLSSATTHRIPIWRRLTYAY